MRAFLIVAPHLDTLQLYQKSLAERDILAYGVKDLEQALLALLLHEDITDIALVDEATTHELRLLAEVIEQRFALKKGWIVSPRLARDGWVNCFTASEFFGQM